MNRYPLWKYIVIGVALVIAFLYTLPNFFGEVPAVQVMPVRTTEKVDAALMQRVEAALKTAGMTSPGREHGSNAASRRVSPIPIPRSRPRMCCSNPGQQATRWP
jgi:preprotein translocase subunit SecD